MKQPTLAVLSLVALSFAGAGEAHAQSTPPLTVQDQVEIQQLAARFAFALDTRAGDGNGLADLFTAEGELVGPRGSAKGHADLAALARRGVVSAERPAVDVSHFSMNHVIQPAAGGATGKEYVVVVHLGEDARPGGEFSNIGGHYEDAYIKTPAGWRFKRREFIPNKSAARPRQAGAAAPGAKPAAAATPAPTLPVASLTAEDFLAIRALASTYAYGLDTGADNGALYASVFTEDAEFHGPPAVPGGKPFDAKGREALRQFALVDRGSAYVRHFMSNHLIEPSPEGARGKVYLLVIDIAEGDRPTSVNMGGHYEDVYVKTAAGWRIKSRNFFRSKSAQTLKAEAEAVAGAAPAK